MENVSKLKELEPFDATTPPQFFMPPIDQAIDIYALSDQLSNFDHYLYQDIQEDGFLYDSLQRWPYLFYLVTQKT